MKKQSAITAPIVEPFYLKGFRPLLIISLFIFLLYLPTIWYGFSPMDERWVIIQHKEAMRHFYQVPEMFSQSTLGMYYRPVWTSSFVIDMALGNGSAGIFHFTNIILHVLCSLLLYRFFLLLGFAKNLSFVSALIFAIHPLNLHTVAWIPGRNDSLLCLFTLLSCHQLLRYFITQKTSNLIFHLLTFIMALFTKENAIILPFIFLLLWYVFTDKKPAENLFLHCCLWITIAVAWFFLRMSLINYFPPASKAISFETIGRFVSSLLIYAGKIMLPVYQSVMPVLQDTPLFPFIFIIAALILFAFRFGFRNKKIAFFGLAWFLIFIIIPAWVGTTNSNQEHYEHRIYTSMIGMLIFLSQLKFHLSRNIASGVFGLLLLLLTFKTIYRSPAYKSELSFLEAVTDESPSIAFLHDMLGFKYAEQKKYAQALVCFNDAIRLNPKKADFYNDRGNLHFQTKNYMLALQDFNKTMEDDKGKTVKLINRSMTYFYLGKHSEALHDLEAAQSDSEACIPAEYVTRLYNAFQKDTIEICTQKLKKDSLDASSYNTRGIAKLRLGIVEEALCDFNRALLLRPNSAAIKSNQQFALTQLNSGIHP
ncbi:MAG: tetratricopeptide repeat protein [Bacteroidia bacterium]